jgi:hypothetical protein
MESETHPKFKTTTLGKDELLKTQMLFNHYVCDLEVHIQTALIEIDKKLETRKKQS